MQQCSALAVLVGVLAQLRSGTANRSSVWDSFEAPQKSTSGPTGGGLVESEGGFGVATEMPVGPLETLNSLLATCM